MVKFKTVALSAALACSLVPTAFAHGDDDDRGGWGNGPDRGRAERIAARQKVFGIENVDRNTGAVKNDVVFSWLGHNTGAVAFSGRVVLMDSYIARLEVTPGRTPFAIKDIVDLKPEAIFISHGHGDHADNAAFIAAKTGATLYMSPEACGTAQTALTRMKNDAYMQADPFFRIPQRTSIQCVGMTAEASVPATQVVRVRQLDPQVCVLAYRALHSVGVPLDPDWGDRSVIDTPDPNDGRWFPPGVPLTPSTPRHLGQQDLRQGAGPGGVDQINYQFILRKGHQFSIMFNSSIGALKEGKGRNWPNGTPADGQRLIDLVRNRLPATDLLFTTLDTGNLIPNGWRDQVMWTEAIRPKVLSTGHVPVGAAMQYYSGLMSQMELMEQPRNQWRGFPREDWPQVRNHTDPTDILKPQVFDANDPAWKSPQKAGRVAQFCG
jgi:hypothetical protein